MIDLGCCLFSVAFDTAASFINAPGVCRFEIRGRIKEYTPYIIVSLQESDRMNVLLQAIRNSLTELELGISGALNVSDGMELLSKNLQGNKVY